MQGKEIEYLKEYDMDDDYFRENVLIALEVLNKNLITIIQLLKKTEK